MIKYILSNSTSDMLEQCDEQTGWQHALTVLYTTLFAISLSFFIVIITVTVVLAYRMEDRVKKKRSWVISLDLVADNDSIRDMYDVFPSQPPDKEEPATKFKQIKEQIRRKSRMISAEEGSRGSQSFHRSESVASMVPDLRSQDAATSPLKNARRRSSQQIHKKKLLVRTESEEQADFVIRLINSSNMDIYYDKLHRRKLQEENKRLGSIPEIFKKKLSISESKEGYLPKYMRSRSLPFQENNSSTLTIADIRAMQDIVESDGEEEKPEIILKKDVWETEEYADRVRKKSNELENENSDTVPTYQRRRSGRVFLPMQI